MEVETRHSPQSSSQRLNVKLGIGQMFLIMKKVPALLPASAQPHVRRGRCAARPPATVRHLIMPGLEVARRGATARDGDVRRTDWATRDRKYSWQFRKGLPTILEINGEAVLRRDWRHRRIGVLAGSLRLLSAWREWRAKQVVKLVALIAASALNFGPVRSLPRPSVRVGIQNSKTSNMRLR
jgi:hypothetical protein